MISGSRDETNWSVLIQGVLPDDSSKQSSCQVPKRSFYIESFASFRFIKFVAISYYNDGAALEYFHIIIWVFTKALTINALSHSRTPLFESFQPSEEESLIDEKMDFRQSNHDDERTSLVFSVRGPIPIQLGRIKLPLHQANTSWTFSDDSTSSWGSGSSVLDLIFPQPETVSEIRFRNYYTARLSLLARFDHDSVQSAPKREHLAWAAAAVSSQQTM